jgi:uncharacterized protein (DUF58 family)
MLRSHVFLALLVATTFLLMVATIVQAGTLIFMATTFLVLMVVAKLQATMALRWLGLRRIAPDVATVGDTVSIRYLINSSSRIKSPLVRLEETYEDPSWMDQVTEVAPFSPPPEGSIEVEYSFVPKRRGLHYPSEVSLLAADSLGIVYKNKRFPTAREPLLVLPKPEAVALDVSTAFGWGISEAESGRSDGSGVEPRGVREYMPGDSLRHIHWRTSARMPTLQVKQFEAGHMAQVILILDTRSPLIGSDADPVLEKAIRNVAFVAQEMSRTGTAVQLLGQGISGLAVEPGRGMRHYQSILEALAAVPTTRGQTIGDYTLQELSRIPSHSAVYWFSSDTASLVAAARALKGRSCLNHLYQYAKEGSMSAEGTRSELAKLGVRITDVFVASELEAVS